MSLFDLFKGRSVGEVPDTDHYSEEQLRKMTDTELEDLYRGLMYLVMPDLDEPPGRRIPRGKKSFGCKTWGEARDLLGLVGKTMGDRTKADRDAKAKKEKALMETLTDTEIHKLSQISNEVVDSTLRAFKMAANGDVDAMTMIGYTYRLHLNDGKKSAYWIQKAANAGGLDAKFWLGEYYMNGYGVTENRIKGTGLILEVAEKGNKLAIEALAKEFGMSKEEMRSNGIPV